MRAIADGSRAYFVALQVVLDHDNISCRAETTFVHHLLYGVTSRFHVECNNRSLAGSVSVGLGDHGNTMLFQVCLSCCGISKGAMLRCRDTGAGHQFLRESFAALECGTCRVWPEDAQTAAAEKIGDALY